MQQLWSIEAMFGFVALMTPVALVLVLIRQARRCERSRDEFDSGPSD